MGLATLVVTTLLFGNDHIHVATVNDQALYITASRRLADTGEIDPTVLYPSAVGRPRFRLYMPGYFNLLATSYRVFGYGVLPSLLPGMMAYLSTLALVYLLGVRRWGDSRALIAGIGFALAPANLFYAMQAVPEASIQGVFFAIIALLVVLPSRTVPMFMPLGIGLAYYFRETGLSLVAFVGVTRFRELRPNWRAWAVSGLSTIIVIFLIHHWQVADGKARFPLEWVLEHRFNYDDVTSFPRPLGWIAFASGILSNFVRNTLGILELMISWRHAFVASSLWICLGCILGAAVGGAAAFRRDPFPLAAGAVGLVAVLATMLFYDHSAVLRMSWFSFPSCLLGCVGLLPASNLDHPIRPSEPAGKALRTALGTALVLYSVGSAALVTRAGLTARQADAATDSDLRILEAIDHDPRTLMIGPDYLILPYAIRHYPTRTCLPPANEPTLRSVSRFLDIGTFLASPDYLENRVPEGSLRAVGLERIPLQSPPGDLVVFRRR